MLHRTEPKRKWTAWKEKVGAGSIQKSVKCAFYADARGQRNLFERSHSRGTMEQIDPRAKRKARGRNAFAGEGRFLFDAIRYSARKKEKAVCQTSETIIALKSRMMISKRTVRSASCGVVCLSLAFVVFDFFCTRKQGFTFYVYHHVINLQFERW